MRDDYWWITPMILLGGAVLLALGALGIIGPDAPADCEEYGTVMVTIDDDKRCVPWEQAPDLQDFPQP